METILPTHPERSLRLIQRSFMLYSASFARVFLLALVLSITVFFPRFLSIFLGQDLLAQIHPLSWHSLWMWVINLIGLMFFIAMIWRIHCIDRGYHEPLIDDFKIGFKKLLYVVIAALLQGALLFALAALTIAIQYILHRYNLLFNQTTSSMIITLITFIGQFLLILYVSTLFIFYVPLIAIEDKGVFSALERSVSLAWNHWWRILSLQLIPWLFYLFILFFIRNILAINVNIYFIKNSQTSFWIAFLQMILFAVFLIWAACLLLVQLKDLELRKFLRSKERHDT